MAPLSRLEPVQAEPRRDCVEPRRELGLAAEFADRPVDAQEHLLRDLLGFCRVAQHSNRHPEHAVLIASHELLERVPITGPQSLHEPRGIRSMLSHR